ncbi:hypothetical protein YC2023_001594 [Brassica napus]
MGIPGDCFQGCRLRYYYLPSKWIPPDNICLILCNDNGCLLLCLFSRANVKISQYSLLLCSNMKKSRRVQVPPRSFTRKGNSSQFK